jgi:hypothetical protein
VIVEYVPLRRAAFQEIQQHGMLKFPPEIDVAIGLSLWFLSLRARAYNTGAEGKITRNSPRCEKMTWCENDDSRRVGKSASSLSERQV